MTSHIKTSGEWQSYTAGKCNIPLDLQVIQPALVVAVLARLTVSAMIFNCRLVGRGGGFPLLRVVSLCFSFPLHGQVVSVLLVDCFAVVGAVSRVRLGHAVLGVRREMFRHRGMTGKVVVARDKGHDRLG